MSANTRSIWCWAGVRSMGSMGASSAATGANKGEGLGISALRSIRAPRSDSHRTAFLGRDPSSSTELGGGTQRRGDLAGSRWDASLVRHEQIKAVQANAGAGLLLLEAGHAALVIRPTQAQ